MKEIPLKYPVCNRNVHHANFMVELINKAAKEVTGKDVMQRLHGTRNRLLTKYGVLSNKATKRELSLQMRSSNIGTEFIPISLKKQKKVNFKVTRDCR